MDKSRSLITKAKILLRLKQKDELILTRPYHPSYVKAFWNSEYYNKAVSNRTITHFTLLFCFAFGYACARLANDEFTRRRGYARNANFMILFDSVNKSLTEKYNYYLGKVAHFDHSYYFWRSWKLKIEEIKVRRKLEREILKMQVQKEGAKDEISAVLLELDEAEPEKRRI
mmetsp:Transcript_48490/g.35689  ORF Transcript_48490/g.35689 Transcript_48490/m.35689 type:complete len:171 (+) Transcript_48490:2-514(+)